MKSMVIRRLSDGNIFYLLSFYAPQVMHTAKNQDVFMEMNLSPFIGKWVAICDDKVVASSPTFRETFNEAKRLCPGKHPLVAMVPSNENLIL